MAYYDQCIKNVEKNKEQHSFLFNQIASYATKAEGLIAGEQKYKIFSKKDIEAIVK